MDKLGKTLSILKIMTNTIYIPINCPKEFDVYVSFFNYENATEV